MTTTTDDQASALGAAAAARGAAEKTRSDARAAEREAEREADEVRRAVPVEIIGQRFAQLAGLVAGAINAHVAAAEIDLVDDAVMGPGTFSARTHNDVRVMLQRAGRAVTISVRSPWRGWSWADDLDAAEFEAEPIAAKILHDWMALTEGGSR